MNELELLLADRLMEEFEVGRFETFCDETDYRPAEREEVSNFIAGVIREWMGEEKSGAT